MSRIAIMCNGDLTPARRQALEFNETLRCIAEGELDVALLITGKWASTASLAPSKRSGVHQLMLFETAAFSTLVHDFCIANISPA